MKFRPNESGLLLPDRRLLAEPRPRICTSGIHHAWPVGGGVFDPTNLLLHFDGSDGSTVINDSSPFARVLTGNADCRISTAQSKFGGSSLRITDMDNGGISIASSTDFAKSVTAPYSIDFWFYHVSSPNSTGSPTFISMPGSGGGTANLNNYGLTVKQSANFGGGTIGPQATPASSNAWHHIYLGHDPLVAWAICVDGVPQSGLTGGAQGSFHGSSASVLLFSGGGGGGDVFIDEFRLAIGELTYPLAGFTPPTAPYA